MFDICAEETTSCVFPQWSLCPTVSRINSMSTVGTFTSGSFSSTLTKRCQLSCSFLHWRQPHTAQNRGFLHISYAWVRIWTDSRTLGPVLNQSDCDSCWFISHHCEEDTASKDNRTTTTGKDMTHPFSLLLLLLQLIAAVIQNRWSGGWGFFKAHKEAIWIETSFCPK